MDLFFFNYIIIKNYILHKYIYIYINIEIIIICSNLAFIFNLKKINLLFFLYIN